MMRTSSSGYGRHVSHTADRLCGFCCDVYQSWMFPWSVINKSVDIREQCLNHQQLFMFINATCYKLLISFIVVNLTFMYKEISPLMYTCVKLNGGTGTKMSYKNLIKK